MGATTRAGLIDTSVLIAKESGRPLAKTPTIGAISVMTLAELHLGVLKAPTTRLRTRRLRTLSWVENTFDALHFDTEVARLSAQVLAAPRRGRKRLGVADAIIAATALVHGLDLYTQDADFEGILGLRVVKV